MILAELSISEGRAIDEEQVLELKRACQLKCNRCAITGGTVEVGWNPYQLSRCKFFNVPVVGASSASQVLSPLCHDELGALKHGILCQNCLRCAGQSDLHSIVAQPGMALPLFAQILLLCNG